MANAPTCNEVIANAEAMIEEFSAAQRALEIIFDGQTSGEITAAIEDASAQGMTSRIEFIRHAFETFGA